MAEYLDDEQNEEEATEDALLVLAGTGCGTCLGTEEDLRVLFSSGR